MTEYDDIINLPHPEPRRHARMAIKDRAAQFSPFAALTGHEEAIRERGRLTQARVELDESEKMKINATLEQLFADGKDRAVTMTYFKKDERKEGGEYITVSARILRFDEYSRALLLDSGDAIPIDDLLALE